MWGGLGSERTMPRTVLFLDKQVQLEVLVPNILVGAANLDFCGQSSRMNLIQLRTIHTLRLVCEAWKYVVDQSTEYNAFSLAEYNYAIYPYQKTIRCQPKMRAYMCFKSKTSF